MAIDPSIVLKGSTPSLGDIFKDAMAIRQSQQLGSYYGAKAAAARDELESQQTLRGTLAGLADPYGTDRPATLKALLMASPEKFTQFGKQDADWSRSEVNLSRDKLKSAMEHNEAVGQLIGASVDQPTYTAALDRAEEMGIDTSKLPKQYVPGFVDNLRRQNLSIRDQLGEMWKQRRFDQTQENIDEDNARADRNTDSMISDRNSRRGLTARGQDMASSDRRRGQDMTDKRERGSYSYSHGGGRGRPGGGGASGGYTHTATDASGRKVGWNGSAWVPVQ